MLKIVKLIKDVEGLATDNRCLSGLVVIVLFRSSLVVSRFTPACCIVLSFYPCCVVLSCFQT